MLECNSTDTYHLAIKLINKGMNIDIKNVKNIHDLVREIKKAGNKHE